MDIEAAATAIKMVMTRFVLFSNLSLRLIDIGGFILQVVNISIAEPDFV